MRLGVDWVALSFVQHAADMADLRRLVNRRAAILAKIEKPAALRDLEEILDVAGTGRLEACRHLAHLLWRGIISV